MFKGIFTTKIRVFSCHQNAGLPGWGGWFGFTESSQLKTGTPWSPHWFGTSYSSRQWTYNGKTPPWDFYTLEAINFFHDYWGVNRNPVNLSHESQYFYVIIHIYIYIMYIYNIFVHGNFHIWYIYNYETFLKETFWDRCPIVPKDCYEMCVFLE